MEDKGYVNEDRVLFTEPNQDWKDEGYMPKIFVTKENAIGMIVGGMVYVKTKRQWHKLAEQEELLKG